MRPQSGYRAALLGRLGNLRRRLRWWRRVAATAARSGPRATLLAYRARSIPAKQKLAEHAGLLDLVADVRPRVVVEIGTLHGGTLWGWCRVAAGDATIVSVDLPGGAFGGGYAEGEEARLRGYARPGQRLHLLRADSRAPETVQAVRELLPAPVDFLFIDGDHSYEGAAGDFELYAPFVRPGGLIAFHDVLPHDVPGCEVDRLWRELRTRFRHVELTDEADRGPTGAGWGGIGVLFADPTALTNH